MNQKKEECTPETLIKLLILKYNNEDKIDKRIKKIEGAALDPFSKLMLIRKLFEELYEFGLEKINPYSQGE